MSSKVEIANSALAQLGDIRLLSLTDENETARKVNAIYDLKVNELLSLYPWSFAKKRRSLALLEDAPLFGYQKAFQLPSDIIRLLEINGGDREKYEHQVEGDKLLINAETCEILYVREVVSSENFPVYFVMALASYLAFELAYAITQSHQIKKEMYDAFMLKLASAKSIDAQSGGDYRRIRQDDILLVRNRENFDGVKTGTH